MTPEMRIVVAILVLPLALNFLERWRVDMAGLFMMVALGISQFMGLGVLSHAWA